MAMVSSVTFVLLVDDWSDDNKEDKDWELDSKD